MKKIFITILLLGIFLGLTASAANSADITGVILYNAMAITNYTNRQPSIWMRDEDTGQAVQISPQYNTSNGIYIIPDVPPGRYGVSVFIDDAEPFGGNGFPGDYDGWNSPIEVSEYQTIVNKNLNCQKTIHLTSPVDNISEIGYIDEYDTYYNREMLFSWDAIAEASTYEIRISKYQSSPYQYIENVYITESPNTQVTIILDKNLENQHYQLDLYAKNSNEVLVGKLMVSYYNGYGWDYRFRNTGPLIDIFFSDALQKPGSVYHYDPETETETSIYTTRPRNTLPSFCFSPWNQDKLYFVKARDSRIFVKDLSISASPEQVFYKHTTFVSDIAFNSEGVLFFIERRIKGGSIWRLGKDGEVSLFYTVNLPTVEGLWSGNFTFDKDDNLYLSLGNQVPASIFRVNVPLDTLTKVYTDENGAIKGMVFDEDDLLYYADGKTRIYCLNLTNGQRQVIYDNPSRKLLSDVAFRVPEIPATDATGLWVMPYGIGGTRLDQIKTSGLTDYTDKISGYSMKDAPFGSYLGFRLGWANDIPIASIKYYRLQYKYESELEWHDFTEPVYVHYVKEAVGQSPRFPTYTIGPHDVDGKNLYEFRPHEEKLPLLVPVGPGERVSWPQILFLEDIYCGFLNTEALHLAQGRYNIKFEVYDKDGNLVFPGGDAFNFVVPKGVDTDGTILTDIAAPGSIDGGGFVFTIHIDNRSCEAVIDEPMINSEGAGECGFLRYNQYDDPGPPVHISFHATHPDRFALFNFRIVRGSQSVGTTVVNGSEVSSISAGVYAGDSNGNFEHDFLRSQLLEYCNEAAFSEILYVYAKATTGWSQRINRFDASAVRAFALTPQ